MKELEYKQDAEYCHLCGKEIVYDGVEPLPLTMSCGEELVHYCSEHAEIGMEICDKFFDEIYRLERTEGHCDEPKLLNKIESQYKDNAGDWYIKFRNTKNYGREVIDIPILKDNKPVGYIMNVNDSYVTGKIWSRYILIVEEVFADKRVTGFEIVC